MMDNSQPAVWQPSATPTFRFLLNGWTKDQLVMVAVPYGATLAELLKYLIKVDAYQPWVWLIPLSLLLIGAFFAQRLVNRQSRLQQAELEKLRPAGIEAHLVKAAVFQEGVQTGEDQGWLWFEGPLLRYSGLRCEIRLTADKATGIQQRLSTKSGSWEIELRESSATLEFSMESKEEVEVPPQRLAAFFERWEGFRGLAERPVSIYPEDVQLEFWQGQGVNWRMFLWSLALQAGIALWMFFDYLESQLGKAPSAGDSLLYWKVFAITGLMGTLFVWLGAARRARRFRERGLRLASNR